MKTYTIAVQDGLDEIKAALQEKGHAIVTYAEAATTADIAVISGIDSAYEEIETSQCMIQNGEGGEMLLINATGLSPEQVLERVERNNCT